MTDITVQAREDKTLRDETVDTPYLDERAAFVAKAKALAAYLEAVDAAVLGLGRKPARTLMLQAWSALA